MGLTIVCGGGGLWGTAWMTGLIAGLAESGLDLRMASKFIGTSAGSVVASQFTSSLSTDYLYNRQTDPALQPDLKAPPPAALRSMIEAMGQPRGTAEERIAFLRNMAEATQGTMSSADRQAEVSKRLGLPAPEWPEQDLAITAVDLETGALCVFTKASGVALLDAVSASTAVPGIWPATEINGKLYVDGGAWKTAENAHLAQGAERVLILAPLGGMLGGPGGFQADVAALEAAGSRVTIVSADDAARRAMAPNPLDPATRKPAAEAGRAQAATVAEQIRPIL